MHLGGNRRLALGLASIAIVVAAAMAASMLLGPSTPASGGPASTPASGAFLGPGSTALPDLPMRTARSKLPPGGTPGAGPAVPPTPNPTPKPTLVPTTPPTLAPTAIVTAASTPAPPTAGPVPPLSACPIFPSTNVWNRRVDGLPVASNGDALIAAIGLGNSLHPDFSDAGGYGIPYNVVGASTPRSAVSFQYDDESDHGPYPIPVTPKIEGGSDRHLLMVDSDACALYELFAAANGTSGWNAGSGATWDLGSNALRPDGWTSADAAGLPIFPGLVRYAEVKAGAINHAIRFTAPSTCAGYDYPARHQAGSGSCDARPPMGLRVRLKASVDIGGFGPQSRVILAALQQYGMLLADNGSAWYITGAPDSRWDDDELHGLGGISGADFEVVDTSGFVNG